jgi:hypothetical protein
MDRGIAAENSKIINAYNGVVMRASNVARLIRLGACKRHSPRPSSSQAPEGGMALDSLLLEDASETPGDR